MTDRGDGKPLPGFRSEWHVGWRWRRRGRVLLWRPVEESLERERRVWAGRESLRLLQMSGAGCRTGRTRRGPDPGWDPGARLWLSHSS